MPHLYILYSDKIDKYYVGACTNLERRLYEHNIGHSTKGQILRTRLLQS
ncbi:MAG: hypothetical protein EAZ16_12140 [Sphingobacteriales bacterium]|nr:MAG: hypothetical protein EAZ16_12140 [Sphingobacteriales bacterium]